MGAKARSAETNAAIARLRAGGCLLCNSTGEVCDGCGEASDACGCGDDSPGMSECPTCAADQAGEKAGKP